MKVFSRESILKLQYATFHFEAKRAAWSCLPHLQPLIFTPQPINEVFILIRNVIWGWGNRIHHPKKQSVDRKEVTKMPVPTMLLNMIFNDFFASIFDHNLCCEHHQHHLERPVSITVRVKCYSNQIQNVSSKKQVGLRRFIRSVFRLTVELAADKQGIRSGKPLTGSQQAWPKCLGSIGNI